jgi:hypothetical protein
MLLPAFPVIVAVISKPSSSILLELKLKVLVVGMKDLEAVVDDGEKTAV